MSGCGCFYPFSKPVMTIAKAWVVVTFTAWMGIRVEWFVNQCHDLEKYESS